MDIQFYGANCVVLSNKQTRIVIDDNLADLGGKSITKEGDIALFSGAHGEVAVKAKMVIDQPGEYEVQGISIYGIPARSSMDEAGKHEATMYKVINDDITILVVGHVYPELSDDQLETISMVDVMLVPVGGNGYTLDAGGALTLIKKVDPKLVIPTHYAEKGLNFPVPQATLEEALKNLPMEAKEPIQKLRVKPTDLSDVTQLVILERQ